MIFHYNILIDANSSLSPDSVLKMKLSKKPKARLREIRLKMLVEVYIWFSAQVLCCKWDGCNSDVNSAKLSKVEYEQYLLQQILGSEYDHFVPFDKSEQFDGGERTKEGLESQLNSPSPDTANESVTSNRRIGTFYSGSTFHKNNKENGKLTSRGDSKIFSNGFPKYFKTQLQVIFFPLKIDIPDYTQW